MRIAVNCRLLRKDRMEGIAVYTWEICRHMAESYPENQYYFFFDRQPSKEFCRNPNVTPVILRPQARHPLLWHLWFEYALPRALKKYNIDVFFSPEAYLSKSTNVPTVMAVHDLGFLHYPETYKRSHLKYFRRNTGEFLREANSIIAVSNFTKSEILNAYPIDEQKIVVAGNASRHSFVPINEKNAAEIRQAISKGQPYFLYLGSIHPRKNIPCLIKAFEQFKQGTSAKHQLILYGRWAFNNDALRTVLENSPYKDNIILCNDQLMKLEKAVAAAFCLIYPSLYEGFGIPILEAMSCGIAVITSDRGAMREVGGLAANYFNPEKIDDLATAMIKASQSHVDQQKLSDNVARYSWEKSAHAVHRQIIKAGLGPARLSDSLY